MSSEVYKKIEDIVGEEYVTDSDFEKFFYTRDVSPLTPELQEELGTIPDLIARPKTTQEVSEIVKIAAANKVSIVPRGGASWWLGGSVPYKGGIVLDLTSMNKRIEVDEGALIVTADSGVTWKEVEDILDRKSYFLGTRPGSANSATIGGWISTGGVGFGSYKYGSVGDLVRNLVVVLPNGEIIQTGNKKLATNGSGYNLNELFIGAEGTLGVITEATLKIIPQPEGGQYHLSYTFPDLKSCMNAIQALVSSRLLPHHIAFGDRKHFELLNKMGKPAPTGEITLCITLEGEKGIIEFGKSKLNELFKSSNGTISCENEPYEKCADCSVEFRGWGMNVHPVPGEIFVGLDNFEEALMGIYKLLDEMGVKAAVVGSMVDRRTVMLMPYYIHEQDSEWTFMEFHRALEKVAMEVGGRRIGLGMYFSSSLKNIHEEANISLMRAIKKSIDPDNIMNPGKTIADNDIYSKTTGFL